MAAQPRLVPGRNREGQYPTFRTTTRPYSIRATATGIPAAGERAEDTIEPTPSTSAFALSRPHPPVGLQSTGGGGGNACFRVDISVMDLSCQFRDWLPRHGIFAISGRSTAMHMAASKRYQASGKVAHWLWQIPFFLIFVITRPDFSSISAARI